MPQQAGQDNGSMPLLGRVVLISIGVRSVWWGIATFPVFWRAAGLEHTADSIIDGEEFKREILQTVLADADSPRQEIHSIH